jgi:ParB-like nuclease domain
MRHRANKRPKETCDKVSFHHTLASAVEPSVPNRIELAPIDTLRPNSRNSRTHSKKQIRQIASSIRTFGFLSPLSSTRGASFSQGTAVFRPRALKVSLTYRSSGRTTSRRRKNAPT